VDRLSWPRRAFNRPWVQASAVFLGYLIVSFVIFGLPIVHNFSVRAVGDGSGDLNLYAWAMGWWPYALSHHISPLHTALVWAPSGVNLAWATTLPGPALLMWPITSTFGPVFSLNVLSVLAPALNGWAAFLLCRRAAGGRAWPAVAGGLLFGFSAYVSVELLGHVNLYLVFPVPLAAYLVARALDGSMRNWVFAILFALVIVAEFSISTEITATMAMFGGLAFFGALLLAPDLRGRLLRLLPWVAVGGALAAAVLFAYLMQAVRAGPGQLQSQVAAGSSAVNLLSYLLPRPVLAFGGVIFRHATRQFHSNGSEDGAYLTPTLLVALGWAAWSLRRDRVTRNVLVFGLVAVVLSLGVYLSVGSMSNLTPMPWYLGVRVPVIRDALPMRFTMYVWLAVAVVVARWLSAGKGSLARWGLIGVTALLLLPATWRGPWSHLELTAPAFFSTDLVNAIPEGETVLIVHVDPHPKTATTADPAVMFWQEQAHFRFAMPQGHTGPQVHPITADDVWVKVHENNPKALPANTLRAWLDAYHIGAVVVVDGSDPGWGPLLVKATGSPGQASGGVELYFVRAN
jgi:hypothetical protein